MEFSVSGRDADGLVSSYRFNVHPDRTSTCPDGATRESECTFHFGMSGRLINLSEQA
jgi:hypothetical protein